MHLTDVKSRELITNIQATSPKISIEYSKIITQLNTVKRKPYKSPIHPPSKMDIFRKSHILNPELNNEKIKTTPTKLKCSPESKMNHPNYHWDRNDWRYQTSQVKPHIPQYKKLKQK